MWPELSRLTKGSIIYGVGGVLQRFLSLLLLPFFTRVLTPEEYGAVAIIGLLSVAFVGLFNLGTGNSMGVLYFERDSAADRNRIVSTTALLLAVNCLFIFTLLFFSAPSISFFVFGSNEYANLIRIALASTVTSTIMEPFYAHLRFQDKALKFVLLTATGALIGAALSVVFVLGVQWGVTGLLLAALLAQLVSAVLVAVFVARRVVAPIDKTIFLPLIRIGFPSIFGILAFLVIDYMDRYMLQRMINLNAVGIYSVGYNMALAIMVAISAFSTAWPPFYISFLRRQNDAIILFGKILKYYLIIFGFITLLFFIIAKPLTVLLAPQFETSYQVIGLVASAYMLKGAYLILLPGIAFAKKFHWQSAIEWAAAFANVGLNLLLIPIWGISGAAVATLASYVVMTVLAWAVAQRYLTVDYDWRRILITTGAIMTSCAWVLWASWKHSLAGIAIHSTLALVLLIVVFASITLTSKERQKIGELATRILDTQK